MHARISRLGRGAGSAAVGLAASVVALSLMMLAAGAIAGDGGALGGVVGALDSHPGGGLISALFGMGVPLEWTVEPLGITGAASAVGLAGQTPVALVATAIVAGGALVAGILAVRRRTPVATAVWFAVLSAAAAVVVSHLRPISVAGGLRAELDVSPLATALAAALWASAAAVGSALLHRRWADRLVAVAPARLPHRQLGQGLVASSLALVVLAGCAGSGGDVGAASGTRPGVSGSTSTTATPETTTTVGPDGATTTTVNAGGPSRGRGRAASPSTTAGGATTTTGAVGNAAAAGTAAGPATAPGGGLAPPAPGSYRYDTSGSISYLGTRKPFPAVTSLVVDPAAGLVQHSVRDLGGGGEGMTIEQKFDYRRDGIYVKQQRVLVSLGALKSSKAMKPVSGGMWLPTNAGPGHRSEFALTGADVTGHETVDVLRAERVTVGGQPVDALLIRTVLTFTGAASGRIALDQWFVRSHRLVAKEHLDGDVKASIVRLTTSYDAVLQRLTP